MTPAIQAARRARIAFTVHAYRHDPQAASYGDEAVCALGLDPARVCKTLLVALNADARRLAVGIVPVNAQLDLKAFAAAMGVKKAVLAEPGDAERATGYVLGGISPLAQKKALPTLLETTVSAQPTIYVSAGRRGLEIELAPRDLLRLCAARLAPIAR